MQYIFNVFHFLSSYFTSSSDPQSLTRPIPVQVPTPVYIPIISDPPVIPQPVCAPPEDIQPLPSTFITYNLPSWLSKYPFW